MFGLGWPVLLDSRTRHELCRSCGSLTPIAGFEIVQDRTESRAYGRGRPMRRSNILKSEQAMKTTMSALAAVALVAATDVRAQETGSSNTVQLPGSKDAKVTLVYQHALPGILGKSVKGVLVEYGPGGYSPSHTHAKSALIYATVIEGERSAVRSTTGQKEHTAPARTGRNCPETIISSVRTRARQSPPRFSRSLSLTIRTRCSRYPTNSEASRPWLSSLPSHLSAISSHPVLFSKDIHAEGQG
jgi:hypothetical protein